MSMTLRVSVTDGTLDRLTQRSGAQRDPEYVASQLLSDAAECLPAAGRYVVVAGPELEALERILGGGSVTHGTDLRVKVERLAGISFQHIRLQFSPGQLEELARRAERQGRTVEQIVEMMVPRIHEQFFNLIDNR